MNIKDIAYKSKRWLRQSRWVIVVIILLVLSVEIIGFIVKWGPHVLSPLTFLNSYHNVISDLFSILVTYEIFDLLYTLSPVRLMDVILLTIARKIVLASPQEGLIQPVSAFCLLLIVRLAWYVLDKNRMDVEKEENKV